MENTITPEDIFHAFSPDGAELEFSNCGTKWVRRSLASINFGFPKPFTTLPESGTRKRAQWQHMRLKPAAVQMTIEEAEAKFNIKIQTA